MYCFGVSRHGKGLVDVMSGFGVKDPLRKAVVTEDLHYDSVQDIVSYLQELFKDDPYKIHFELNPQETHSVDKVAVKITDVRKQHMLCFLSSGTIQIKENTVPVPITASMGNSLSVNISQDHKSVQKKSYQMMKVRRITSL